MKSLLGWAAGFALALAPVALAAQEGEATPDMIAGMMSAFAAVGSPADLTPTERKGLARLAGMTVEELEGEWIGEAAAEGY
jgi:hypothetical protein